MFCARGGVVTAEEKKQECLCETCELFKKFRLEDYCFCQLKKKENIPEENTPEKVPAHPDVCADFQTSAGTIRVCVLGEQNIHTK